MAYKHTQLVGGGRKAGAHRIVNYLNSIYDDACDYMQKVYIDSKDNSAVIVTSGIGHLRILNAMYELFVKCGIPWHEVIIDGNHVFGKRSKPVVLLYVRTAKPELSHLNMKFKPIKFEYP